VFVGCVMKGLNDGNSGSLLKSTAVKGECGG